MKNMDFYVYTPATTDVTIRWRKIYGWVPPTESPKYQKKWANFRKVTAASFESLDDENPANILKEINNDHESLSSNQRGSI